MLLFLGQDMIDHIEQSDNFDLKTEFLVDLALESLFECFPEFDAPAGKLPSVPFVPGPGSALCEENLSGIVEDHRSGADADIVDSFAHDGIIASFLAGVYTPLAIEPAVRYNRRMGEGKERTWYLYILRCGDQTLYTGVTTDVRRRLEMHQKGTASKFTRSRLPVRLVHLEVCGGRSEALKRERAVKKLSRSEKEAYCR